MEIDHLGRVHVSENFLVSELYKTPTLDLFNFLVDNPEKFNQSSKLLHAGYPPLVKFEESNLDHSEFDRENQNNWHMPIEYKQLDIAEFVLLQCNGEAELQRAGHELLRYAELDLFDMLRYFKYLVDTLRKNNVVWGVGRGSSVASFVLYKLGVHKINSLYYNIPIEEFLK